MSNESFWPSLVDYQESLQAPFRAFRDPELQWGKPVMNKLGLPRPISGTFASVYELVDDHRHWAVKCFLRNIPDQHQRYAKISKHLRGARVPYFVTFAYQDQGIRVQGKWFPVVKMEWDTGQLLNRYIESNISKPRKLAKLAKRWIRLLDDLQRAGIAHGDLQHGNVLVRPNGSIRLIDYDGMWVPALEGEASHETGHPDYQLPHRSEHDFDSGIDEFAGRVILLCLKALQHDPSLWERYNNGDNLLFRRQDYLDPDGSPVVTDLRSLGDPEVDAMLDAVVRACGGGEEIPLPEAASSWLGDHVEEWGGRASSSAVATAPAPARTTSGAPRSAGPPPSFGSFLRSLLRLLFRD